jgi:hypothetical protein
VNEKGSTPATSQLANIDLSGVTQVTNSDGYLTDVASNISSYLGTGWTASTYVYANTGMLITGGNLVSPTYSLSGYSQVTVKVTAYSYYSSYYGNATLSVGTGSQTKTQALTDNSTTYTFVLNCGTSDKVTIGSTSNYISVSKIEIYAGDATSVNMLKASETGGETSRTITGITNKYYTVNNLKAGGTFVYKVKAIYTDGTESVWSNIEHVTLTGSGDEPLIGDINGDGEVTIGDMSALIDYLLGSAGDTIDQDIADINHDGEVTIGDVSALIDILLGGN